MKFVYFYADMEDVKKLYHLVEQAQSSIPLKMKPFDQIQTSTVLGQPLAISNYLKGLNPLDKMGENFNNENWNNSVLERKTQFTPTLTDTGLCSTFNAKSENFVFQEQAVKDFQDIFHGHVKAEDNLLESAVMREYTFIIDTQKRRSSNGASQRTNLAK